MALFKCKSCGGDLVIEDNSSVCECEYCGTKQPIPQVRDENLQNLFNRANTLRMKSEFDKAAEIYEKIIQKEEGEAEAYWGLILCRYGIEYVEDPDTFKRIPTCHRASYESITADDDYKSALQYADLLQRRLYEEEAKKIDGIQKNILALAQKDEPYDVFICYKETDENGKRTQDSVIANDIYYQLTQEGFKVFYAAITLEDKLGSEYEPHIFAALNTSKVMLAIGTKPEYFNAVWVKNEWSRFLAMMKKDRSKMLIPCYRDMDAYDLPEEFSHLQAQDMSKIGFINDLVRGIKKVLRKDEPAQQSAPVPAAAGASVAPLLERAFMFLEDGNWQEADQYCEKVLDQDPKNAKAYLGKLLSELKVRKQGDLKNCAQPFDGSANYQKALRFANPTLAATLKEYITGITDRNTESAYQSAVSKMRAAKDEAAYKAAAEAFRQVRGYKDADAQASQCLEKAETARKDEIYNRACDKKSEENFTAAADIFRTIPGFKDADEQEKDCLEKAELARLTGIYNNARGKMNGKTEKDFRAAADIFRTIPGFKDADALAEKCIEQAEVCRKDAIYSGACRHMEKDTVSELEKAISEFKTISGWKDADEQSALCEKKIGQIKAKAEAALIEVQHKAEEARIAKEKAAKKKKKITAAVISIVCACIAFLIVLKTVILPNSNYNAAVKLMNEGKYEDAIAAFEALDGFKDSDEQMSACNLALNELNYNTAATLNNEGKTAEAAICFGRLGDYKDAREQSLALWDECASRETVSACVYHTVGLKADGTVVATGSNTDGQCDVENWTDIVAVCAGSFHTVGLKSDGTVVAVGPEEYGKCNVEGWTDIVAVGAGVSHTVGLKKDGTVIAVGSDKYGQCDVENWTDIVAVCACGSLTVGLKADGTVVATGKNDYGQCNVSDWTDIVAVSASGSHTVGLKSDGTVIATGGNSYGECDVENWTDIVAVSAGDEHTVGLKSDGSVVAVGENRQGQCDAVWKNIKLPN